VVSGLLWGSGNGNGAKGHKTKLTDLDVVGWFLEEQKKSALLFLDFPCYATRDIRKRDQAKTEKRGLDEGRDDRDMSGN
jgi:hypothetical protein